MAKFQLREVQVVGIPQFSSKITLKNFCLLYTRTIIMLITNISLNFTDSYVLDLTRFEDHTFAFFKGKC